MISLFCEWYFLEIPAKIKKIWGNYLWFFAKYFALSDMLRDFLKPWKGLTFSRQKRAFEIGDAFSAMFGNLISRMIGALARLFFVAVGLAAEAAVFVGGIAAYIGWLVLIPAIFYFLLKGLELLV
ncbi:MAG: hypothetical protein WA093_05265 [Minisyncoccales bacterium]